jgi:hypothetical protein
MSWLHVGDLFVVAQRLEIIGIGDVAVAGMDGDEAVQSGDGVFVLVVLVVGIGRHQLGLGGPHRIGVLALHLVEVGRRVLVAALVQVSDGLAVNLVDGLFLVGDLVVAGAGGKRQRDQPRPGSAHECPRQDTHECRRTPPSHVRRPFGN